MATAERRHAFLVERPADAYAVMQRHALLARLRAVVEDGASLLECGSGMATFGGASQKQYHLPLR